MHRITLALALFILPWIHLSGITIKTAYTRYYEDGDIRPIGQYFGGSLKWQGFRTVIASDPATPAGQYFIAKINNSDSVQPTKARMTLYLSNSKNSSTYTWNLTGESVKGWLYLGLTGKDWPSEQVKPLAWKIELLGADDSLMVEWKSFLWEMP